jgi:hypothetical protein
MGRAGYGMAARHPDSLAIEACGCGRRRNSERAAGLRAETYPDARIFQIWMGGDP